MAAVEDVAAAAPRAQSTGRNFCFTRFLLPAEEALLRAPLAPLAPGTVPIIADLAHVKYLVFQFEEGEAEHHAHLQGFVWLDSARRCAFVKALVGNNAHVEFAHDVDASIAYCQKPAGRIAGPWSVGTPPKGGQGTRTDLESIHEKIKAGVRAAELVEECPKALRLEKCIKWDQFLQNEKKSDRQLAGVNVTVLWGDSGSGKTQWAINHLVHNDYFKLDCTGLKGAALWFDGYEGQDTLILDDFDNEVCNCAFLKLLLDKYKLRLQIKGGHSWACWHYVVITSNIHPADWWHGERAENIAALRRRINEIYHCTAGYVYRKQHWDKSYDDSDFTAIPPPPGAVLAAPAADAAHAAAAPAVAALPPVVLAVDSDDDCVVLDTQADQHPVQPQHRLRRTDGQRPHRGSHAPGFVSPSQFLDDQAEEDPSC